MTKKVRIGFIPLVDAAALLIAVDKGFAAREGLDVQLVREVSWSNIRDKLALGHFDAAHLLTPMAVASGLGLNHVRVPLLAPVNLSLNGNAITLSLALYDELQALAGGGVNDPAVSARALGEIARRREAQGFEPLTFGMTFPFSSHNYQLRYWMAEGGVDPDRDLRLVVLPPPFMVESLAKGHVDGFCVGAPWSSVAVDAGVGIVLHAGCEIFTRAPEKVLAMRRASLDKDPELAIALTRAVVAGAAFVDAEENRAEVGALLARPERVGVDAEIVIAALEGPTRTGPAGSTRARQNYLVIGREGACRPEPDHGAWLYAQMLRWGQARHSADSLAAAKSVFRADLYVTAVPPGDERPMRLPDVVGAFAGPEFDDADIGAYLDAFAIGGKL